jgi:hypothetical protein
MIKPYTGPIGSEMDEAVARAEQAGYTVVALEEAGRIYILTTKKAAGVQVSEVNRPTGFLQTFGRH